MNNLQIDVSGEDILKQNYSIVVAETNGGYYAGFKFSKRLITIIKARYGEGKYRYKKSKSGKKYLKLRLYTIIIYLLICNILKQMNNGTAFSLHACRDFDGHGDSIKNSLKDLMKNKFNMVGFKYQKLPYGAAADELAYQLHKKKVKSSKTKLKFNKKFSIKIDIKQIERYLIKKR